MPPFAPWHPSTPWPPSSWSAPPPPRIVSSPAATVDFVAALVADQGVLEGRALDALEAEEPVVTVAARFVLSQRHPDTATAPGRDVGGERGDVIPAGAAVHAVVAVVAVDEVEAARAAAEDVDAETAGHLVELAGAAGQHVVAEVADHPVAVAGPTVDGVVAAAAVEEVGARAAAEKVVAEAADDLVIAEAPPDHVALGGPVQHVVAVGADDLRLAPLAARVFLWLGATPAPRKATNETTASAAIQIPFID